MFHALTILFLWSHEKKKTSFLRTLHHEATWWSWQRLDLSDPLSWWEGDANHGHVFVSQNQLRLSSQKENQSRDVDMRSDWINILSSLQEWQAQILVTSLPQPRRGDGWSLSYRKWLPFLRKLNLHDKLSDQSSSQASGNHCKPATSPQIRLEARDKAFSAYLWSLQSRSRHVTRTKNDELKFSQRACCNRHKL